MAYLDYTRKDSSHSHELTLCLNAEECGILLPQIRKLLKETEKKYEKYHDIHLGGEASENQQNKMMKYENQMCVIESILEYTNELVKK